MRFFIVIMFLFVVAVFLSACAKKKVEDPTPVRPMINLDEEDIERLPER